MSVAGDFRSLILADPGVSALVGSRMYPINLPTPPVYPALTYQRVDTGRLGNLAGPAGRAKPLFRVQCWADIAAGGPTKATQLAEAVRLAIDGFRGPHGGTVFGFIRLAEQHQLYGEIAQVYREVLDFTVSHTEAVN